MTRTLIIIGQMRSMHPSAARMSSDQNFGGFEKLFTTSFPALRTGPPKTNWASGAGPKKAPAAAAKKGTCFKI
jgi:hypothetical protein